MNCGFFNPREVLMYFLAIPVQESFENYFLHEQDANDCGHDAKQYIDDVVMTRVDCCPPNAHTDDGEGCSGKPMLVTLGCIEGGNQHIGCMQTGYGSKYIGIVTIDGVEDRIAHQLVKACQTCHIARCSQDGGEPILHHIPGW